MDLEDRLAWLERLTGSVSAGDSLDAVFDQALDALQNTGLADRASVLLFDDQGVMRFRAWRGLSEAYRRAVDGHTPWQPDEADASILVVPDCHLDEALQGYRETLDAEGIRALAFVPLVSAGRLFGKFMLYRAEPHEFRESELRFARVVANHVAFTVERRTAERALQGSREELDSILSRVVDGISAQGPDGRLLYANDAAARILGLPSRQAMLATPVSEILSHFSLLDERGEPLPLEQMPSRVAMAELRESSATVRFLVNETGEERYSLVSSAPVLDCEGQLRFVVNVFRDVTTERRADQAKDAFLAILGHELRNPLSPILTALELMQRRDPAALASERQVVERQVRHLQRLVDDLLDVSRITRGKLELKVGHVEVGPVVDEVIPMVRPLVEERRHALHVDVTPGLVVLGDGVRLAQVLSNLLANACRYTDPGGHIELVAREVDGQARISVRDNGIGIEPGQLPDLFELFAQAPQPLDRARGGLGLGLTIVKQLVELHGGRIEAWSRGPGTGSVFTVELPLADPTDTVERDAAPAASQEGEQLVLLVDDNVDAAHLLRDALMLLGCSVLVAYDGHQALERILDDRPAIAVLDIGLPGLDGYEVARRVRKRLGSEAPKLVALTGYGTESDRRRALDAGFDVHLTKPIGLDALGRVLASFYGPS